MLITERYRGRIAGVLSCYDRIVIQGTLPGWCYDQGMSAFLYSQGIKIFAYPQFAQGLREELRQNAERIAEEQGIQIEFIRKFKEFRKEARIKAIVKERGSHPGLVHIFSAMEACTSYKPWYDKKTGKTSLRYDSGKCLHYYFYFIDKVFGLCYLRVPTWCPFRLQFYCNGHHWLAHQLDKAHIPYVLEENAFLHIDDFAKAQDFSDSIRIETLHTAIDAFAERYCPVIKNYSLRYRWSIMQAEYATDIVFKKQGDLKGLYESLVRTAIHSVKPENIASFLGQKLHLNYQGEMGNRFNTRILGTRIKHQMGAVSLKMYDKFGLILRIETTTNDVSQFKLFREVHQRNGHPVEKNAAMKKNIYSLFPLMNLLRASNRRYLEFVSTFDDPSQGVKRLQKISKTIASDDRSYKGINFYSEEDQTLLEILARGEFNSNGLQNHSLRQHLHKSSSAVSRILTRLKVHGLLKKIPQTYKYYLTRLGKTVIVAGLMIKEMLLIPELAKLRTSYC